MIIWKSEWWYCSQWCQTGGFSSPSSPFYTRHPALCPEHPYKHRFLKILKHKDRDSGSSDDNQHNDDNLAPVIEQQTSEANSRITNTSRKKWDLYSGKATISVRSLCICRASDLFLAPSTFFHYHYPPFFVIILHLFRDDDDDYHHFSVFSSPWSSSSKSLLSPKSSPQTPYYPNPVIWAKLSLL